MRARPGRRSVLVAAGVVVLVAYALQCATPLRLNRDVVSNLNKAMHLVGDARIPLGYPEEKRPGGYPALVALLDAGSLARSWSLVGMNVLAAFAAAACAAIVGRRALRLRSGLAAAVALLTLANWTWVKHVTLPLPEMTFAALVWLTMLLLSTSLRARGVRAPVLWGAAAAVAGLAIWFRTAGVMLAVPLAWSGVLVVRRRRPDGAPSARRRPPWALGLGIVATLALLAGLLGTGGYVDEFVKRTAGSGAIGLGRLVRMRLSEVGVTTFNFPGARESLPTVLCGIAGCVALAAAIRRRRCWRPDFQLVLALGAGHVLIVGVWPYCAPRFLVPVVPLLAMFAVSELRVPRHRAWARGLRRTALAAYVVLAALAFAHSSLVTFSGDAFPERHAGGTLREAYEAARTGADEEPSSEAQRRALGVLRHYGW